MKPDRRGLTWWLILPSYSFGKQDYTHMLTIKRRNGGYNRNITFHKRERKTGRSPATSLWTPETSTWIFHDWHLKVQTLVHTFTLISGCCMCHPTEACSHTQTKPPFSCFPRQDPSSWIRSEKEVLLKGQIRQTRATPTLVSIAKRKKNSAFKVQDFILKSGFWVKRIGEMAYSF